jgi:hypothetical protein
MAPFVNVIFRRAFWTNSQLNIRTCPGESSIACMALLAISLLSGCAVSRDIDESNAAYTYEQFKNGTIDLNENTSVGLSIQAGIAQLKTDMSRYYRSGDWASLSRLIIKVHRDLDLYWFYLGRSAEGLAFPSAAKHYYEKALSTKAKCKELQFFPATADPCDGVVLPDQARQRLASLANVAHR